MTNLNSLTYYSLHNTHLLVGHLCVTDNQIIHKPQTEKILVFHPHNFHVLIYTPYQITHISHALLIFIIFLIIPAAESVFSV